MSLMNVWELCMLNVETWLLRTQSWKLYDIILLKIIKKKKKSRVAEIINIDASSESKKKKKTE